MVIELTFKISRHQRLKQMNDHYHFKTLYLIGHALGVSLGVKACEVFLCFVTIMFVLFYPLF